MAPINHLYLTVNGGNEEAILADETWQYGIRIGLGLDDIPDVDAPSYAFETSEDSLTDSDANWNVTSNFLCEGGINDLDPADYLLSIGGAVKTFHESATSYFGDSCIVTGLSLYAIGSDGKVINTSYGPAKAIATPTGTIDGGSVTVGLPAQLSTVASLRTINSTRRGRGRIYLPQQTTAILSTSAGIIGTTPRGNIATAVATLLQAMVLDPVGTGVHAAPIVTGAPWSTQFKILEVKVGNVVDAQNRRRRSIVETYTTVSV